MPMVFDLEICDGCRKCEFACPGDVIHMLRPEQIDDPAGSGKTIKITKARLGYTRFLKKPAPYLPRPEECWHCGSCIQDCPEDAITVVFSADMLCI